MTEILKLNQIILGLPRLIYEQPIVELGAEGVASEIDVADVLEADRVARAAAGEALGRTVARIT